MAGGGGGGGDDDVVPVSPRARQPSRGGRRRHKAAACLPLDVIVEIAARSDAATCRGARRRIAEDTNLRGRLRLRDTGRFLLPLLRGHLAGITTYEGGRRKSTVYLVDTTAADTTRLVEATFASAAAAEAETLTDPLPVDSRGGLVLIHASATAPPWQWRHGKQLLVCNPTTGRRLALPPEPAFPEDGCDPEQYVLLVGDRDDGEGGAGVGRRFQVLKAKLLLSQHNPSYRRLLVQTFSSEHGAWSPCTEIIPTPNIHGGYVRWTSLLKALVVGDVVHWLCLTDVGSYLLMLHVRAARVNVTALPAGFPRDGERRRYLLATASAGGDPVVLVADTDKVSAWEQSKHTKMWKPRPQVVIENEATLRFNDDEVADLVETERMTCVPELVWFGERSGAVLLRIYGCCLLWLDLHSKKIVRCFSSDRRMQYACPYEVDLSSWVPTFSSAG